MCKLEIMNQVVKELKVGQVILLRKIDHLSPDIHNP